MSLPIHLWLDALDAELADLAPKHEGLRDFERVDLSAASRTEVSTLREQYDQTVNYLQGVKSSLESLERAGYPSLRVREVSAAVLTELQANRDTIEAALAQFTRATSTLGLAEGGIERKTP